jgi:hypothetical protein
MGVFADMEVGAEVDRGTLRRVEMVVGGNGNDRLVADPVAVHDQAVRKRFDNFSPESCNHRGRIWGKRVMMQEGRCNLSKIPG